MARNRKAFRKRGHKADIAAAAAVLGAAAAATAGKAAHDRRARRARSQAREFRLRPGEPIPDGMRRIARGQIDEAVEQLREQADANLGEAVHEARKALKRSRSLGRLARAAIGEDAYDGHNTALRDAGRKLSPARDGQVLVEAIDDVRERFDREIPPEAAERVRELLSQARDAATDTLEQDGTTATVGTDLEAAGRRVTTWAFGSDDFSALEPGLRRIYRQGRSAFRAARRDPVAERFHEWRKRAKDLWYAASILAEANSKAVKKVQKRAKSLSKVLGDHNDLSVLREQVERHGAQLEPSETAALLALIDRRRARLEDRALKAGRKLYGDAPRAFTRSVERGWKKRMATA